MSSPGAKARNPSGPQPTSTTRIPGCTPVSAKKRACRRARALAASGEAILVRQPCFAVAYTSGPGIAGLFRITLQDMCRNIRTLHNFEPPATDDEVRGAALQYVRKVSGTTKPSQANEEAFERAVDEVARATAELLAELVTSAPPKDREVEAAKRRERAAKRFAA